VAYFVDEMPNNCLHVGLVVLVSSSAKIIDAWRHLSVCCCRVFEQHFVRGQEFRYDLTDVDHYHRDPVSFLSHIDAALPGRVRRIHCASLRTVPGPVQDDDPLSKNRS